MKVLHLWKGAQAKTGAGGGVAMYRLHMQLRQQGVDSKLLCEKESLKSADIFNIGADRKLDRLIKPVFTRLGLNDLYKISSFKLKRNRHVKEADILNIHGTHHGFINYLALPGLTNETPSVFTLHDSWLLTGHCAVSYDCEKWKTGCGNCPYPGSPPAIKMDNTKLEWHLKKNVYKKSNITFVAPCTELYDKACESMLNSKKIVKIPHGLDTAIYKPLEKNQCQNFLGLPTGKFIIMFSAVNMNNFHKGSDLLLDALKSLPESMKNNTLLITVGEGGEELASQTGIKCISFGFIGNERIKALIYSSADIFVSPTRGEAFGLTVLESIACGTPVVAFSVGGIKDLVRVGSTGYPVEPEQSQDLKNKILESYEYKALWEKISLNCPVVVNKEYKIELQAQRYNDLYKEINA